MADKMMKARIRKRKKEAEVVVKEIVYTADTSGLPQSCLRAHMPSSSCNGSVRG